MSVDKSLELEIEIFDEEQSREEIIDFVQIHPGCIAEEIFQGQNKVRRKKMFRILTELKEETIIIGENKSRLKRRSKEERKGSKRNIPLFVNGANPYTVVLSELKNFENIYFLILNKTVNASNNIFSSLRNQNSSKGFWEAQDFARMSSAMYLTLQPLHIFYEFLKIYMVRLITNWSKEIRNKDVLNKVNNMIFAKFASIQIRTNKIMASASESAGIGHLYTQAQMNAIDQLKERLENLKKYDMEKEAGKLLKLVEGILVKEEIRAYFSHKKNRRYRWDLKYKKEDVEDLAEYMYRHRDWMDDSYSS